MDQMFRDAVKEHPEMRENIWSLIALSAPRVLGLQMEGAKLQDLRLRDFIWPDWECLMLKWPQVIFTMLMLDVNQANLNTTHLLEGMGI